MHLPSLTGMMTSTYYFSAKWMVPKEEAWALLH